jgi:DNA polymerase I-like protein with 3'-5' exonuclease and polymerase domains
MMKAATTEKRHVREIMERAMTAAMSLSVPLLVDFEE